MGMGLGRTRRSLDLHRDRMDATLGKTCPEATPAPLIPVTASTNINPRSLTFQHGVWSTALSRHDPTQQLRSSPYAPTRGQSARLHTSYVILYILYRPVGRVRCSAGRASRASTSPARCSSSRAPPRGAACTSPSLPPRREPRWCSSPCPASPCRGCRAHSTCLAISPTRHSSTRSSPRPSSATDGWTFSVPRRPAPVLCFPKQTCWPHSFLASR